MERICIVILNWRSREETVECIKSLKANIRVQYTILVIDNHSDDGSVEYINSTLKNSGFITKLCGKDGWSSISKIPEEELVIYETERNGGYAYGNNIGMKMAFAMGFDYVWILNNDTFIKNDALMPMLEKIRRDNNGIIGSIIKKPSGEVECYGGGIAYPCIGRVRVVRDYSGFKKDMRNFFLMGASILVPKKIYEEVGGLDEKYFMYFEEADWQRNILRAGYFLDVAEESTVFHLSSEKERSESYYYYMSRSGIIFARRYCIFGGFFAAIFIAFSMLIKTSGKYQAIKSILSGVVDGYLINKIKGDK